MRLTSLGIVVLVQNEALHIGRFLNQFKNVGVRIFVVDGFSSDGSLEPYQNLNDITILSNKFETQAQQFNWALSQIGNEIEWILRLDADELLKLDEFIPLYEKLNNQKFFVGASMIRRIRFKNKKLLFGGSGEARCLRLFRRGYGRSTNSLMDEKIELSGPYLKSEVEIVDDSLIPLSRWIAKHNNYSSREALAWFIHRYPHILKFDTDYHSEISSAKRIYYLFPRYIRVVLIFCYRLFFLGGILDGRKGITFLLLQCLYYRWIVDLKISDIEQIRKSQNDKNSIQDGILKNLQLVIEG